MVKATAPAQAPKKSIKPAQEAKSAPIIKKPVITPPNVKKGPVLAKKEKDKLFKFITAKFFFPVYAPEVRDWMKKCSGKNGRGNPLIFSEADIKAIRKGLKEFSRDLQGIDVQ